MYNTKINTQAEAMRQMGRMAEYEKNTRIYILDNGENEPNKDGKLDTIITEEFKMYEIGRIYWAYSGETHFYRVYIEKIEKGKEFINFLKLKNIVIYNKEDEKIGEK